MHVIDHQTTHCMRWSHPRFHLQDVHNPFLKCIFSAWRLSSWGMSFLELLKQDNSDQLSWPYQRLMMVLSLITLKFLLGHPARLLQLIATIFLNLINGIWEVISATTRSFCQRNWHAFNLFFPLIFWSGYKSDGGSKKPQLGRRDKSHILKMTEPLYQPRTTYLDY